MLLLLIAMAPIAPVRPAAQSAGVERLPAQIFDVAPPSVRVRGVAGVMAVQARSCPARPTANPRRLIVDLATQEWAFFGFRIAAPTEVSDDDAAGNGQRRRRGRGRLPPDEAARVASSIAGYWAVTPEGTWIVGRQNDRWNGPDGIAARWNAPWSAAFISWVMCEAGLAEPWQFRRAIAHHAYIDQAIRARDGRESPAAFEAYDVGEAAIAPGDLLCSSRRPAYRTIADRRRQLGVGARSHCDIVVEVSEARRRVLAIGGNVRGVVSLKVLPAVLEAGRPLRVDLQNAGRPLFAHLKLRAAPVDAGALATSPTVRALGLPDVLKSEGAGQ